MDCDVDVVSHAADAITIAAGVPGYGREIGVERWTDGDVKGGCSVFGAEDDVNEEVGEGLGHEPVYGMRWSASDGGGTMGRAFSPRHA